MPLTSMRKHVTNWILVVAAMASIFTFSIAAQRRRAPQKQPPAATGEKKASLKETFDFLREKIKAYAYYKAVANDGTLVEYRAEDVQFDGCAMTLRDVQVLTVNDQAAGTAFTIVNTVNGVDRMSLTDLDVQQVAVKAPESMTPVTTGVLISLLTINKQKLIHSHSETHGYSSVSGSRNYANDADRYSTQIYFTDKDMANRIANAFVHAIGLCAAKKEPF
jgi:hypothetical protein